MEIVTLQAHFDGHHILLDEPYELTSDTKLVVSVIQTESDECTDWNSLSMASLERAYGDTGGWPNEESPRCLTPRNAAVSRHAWLRH